MDQAAVEEQQVVDLPLAALEQLTKVMPEDQATGQTRIPLVVVVALVKLVILMGTGTVETVYGLTLPVRPRSAVAVVAVLEVEHLQQ